MSEGVLKRWVVPALSRAIIYSLTLFYTSVFLVRLLWSWARDPAQPFWKATRREVPPKVLSDPLYGTHAYIQIKNVKLHYVEKGDKTKPLMLLLHGFPEFWYSWRHQIKEFSKDYWTVAVDMRGYGDSEKPEGIKYYRMKYLIDDVKNLIEALGREKCVLVAHDWGGVIGWYFLHIHPQMVESYIFMNAPHPIAFRKMLIQSFSQFQKSWYIFFFQLPYLPELRFRMRDMAFFKNFVFKTGKDPSPFTEEDREAYLFTMGKPGALTFPINYYRANITPDRLLLRQRPAQDIKQPHGLLLFGENDAFLELGLVEKTRRLVHNLKTETIAGASHFVQQDAPEQVNKAMREFLKAGYEPNLKSD